MGAVDSQNDGFEEVKTDEAKPVETDPVETETEDVPPQE